jgi:hypothetical protein
LDSEDTPMPIVRAAAIVLCAAVAVLGGCSGTNLKPDAPPAANLAGSWKLDHAASDDPLKVLEHMRTQANHILSRQFQAAQAQGQSVPPPHGDPLRRSPMAHVIEAAVDRGDFLTIRQGPGEFVLDYGTTRRSFTPGAHSVVSTEGGVGDQTSGWNGREYVIVIRGQMGPDVTESYGLSEDGKRLVQKLHISESELPAVTLTRIYNPTNETAPRQLPTND